jgi:hypothetical protein
MIASDLIRGVLALVFVHDLYVIYAILFTMSVVPHLLMGAGVRLLVRSDDVERADEVLASQTEEPN